MKCGSGEGQGRVQRFWRVGIQKQRQLPGGLRHIYMLLATWGHRILLHLLLEIASHCVWIVLCRKPRDPNGEWWELWDDNHKLPYYYHTTSGQTEWLRPENGTVLPLVKIQVGRLFNRGFTFGRSLFRTRLIPCSCTPPELRNRQAHVDRADGQQPRGVFSIPTAIAFLDDDACRVSDGAARGVGIVP